MATPKPCPGSSNDEAPVFFTPLIPNHIPHGSPSDLTDRVSIPLIKAIRHQVHKNGHMKKGGWKDAKGEKFFNKFDEAFGLFNLELFQLAKAASNGGLVKQEII